MCLFAALLTLPFLYIKKPGLFSWKGIGSIAAWGIIFTILLCGSKLFPVAKYMQNFPREIEDHYYVSIWSSIAGAFMQLVGVMTTLPFLRLIGKSSLVYTVRLTNLTGTPYGFWEIDSSISPVLIVLLLYGIWIALRHLPRIEKKDWLKKGIAAALLLFSVVLVFQFSEARGFLFEHLRGLPVLKSLRTNTRFIASFVLPLAILGAMVFDYWMRGKSGRKTGIAYTLLNGISLISLWAYFLLPLKVQYRSFDLAYVLGTYKEIQAGKTYPVTRIIPEMNDYEVFEAGATNVGRHYDPLLAGHSFQPKVHEGSVFEVTNGFYNLTDPTGYVFPSENHSELFSLIPVAEFEANG